MTNQEHPMTPPPELVQQWVDVLLPNGSLNAFTIATQWGADQELEACCEWVSKYLPYFGDFPMPENKLRIARRPKPPSLKKQALAELEGLRGDAYSMGMGFDAPAIRLALEALPND